METEDMHYFYLFLHSQTNALQTVFGVCKTGRNFPDGKNLPVFNEKDERKS